MKIAATTLSGCKIAVLGSNSFTGSAYVDHALRFGCEVLGISRSDEPQEIFLPYRGNLNRPQYKFVRANLNAGFESIVSALSDFQPSVIVDFAAQSMVAESWDAPENWYQTNIVAKVRLHQFLKDQVWLRKYVRISTPEVYGSSDSLIDETAPYNPSTPYAVSQAAIDMSLKAFYKNYQFPVVTGRFANFYGPHQQLYRIIPKTILCALSGKKLPLHGGGHSVRAFIHSDDVCSAVDCLIDSSNLGETYHFSPVEFVSIRDLVGTICTMLSLKLGDVVEISDERPGKDQAYLMSSAKAHEKLGWSPRIRLEEGLQQTIEWIKENLELMQSMPWAYSHRV